MPLLQGHVFLILRLACAGNRFQQFLAKPRQGWLPHLHAMSYPSSYPYSKINSRDRPERGAREVSDPGPCGLASNYHWMVTRMSQTYR